MKTPTNRDRKRLFRHSRLLGLLSVFALGSLPGAFAQAPASTGTTDPTILQLDPFTVNTAQDYGAPRTWKLSANVKF